jgi:multiple sugar transport system substrate-binding protein
VYGALFAPFNYCFLSPGLQEGKGGYVDMDFGLFKEGWQNFYDMMYTDKTAQDWPSLKSVSADQTYFLKGNSGMMVVGTWFMNILATEIASGKTKIRWGATTVPVSKEMAKNGAQASNGSVTPVVMNARSKNPEAAWQLVKFLASEEAGKIAASYLVTPGYNSNSVVEAMSKVKGFDPSAKDAINKSGLAYPPVSASNKNAGALATMVNKQLELLFTQNQDLTMTVSELTRLRKEILENNN